MFKVSIFTVEGLLHSDFAQEVCIPGQEEQLGILDFHHPIISRLARGTVDIDQRKSFDILDGIAYFDHNELKMIVALA